MVDFSLFALNYFITGLIFGLSFGIKEAGSTTNLLLYIYKPSIRFWNTFRSNLWVIPFFSTLMIISLFVRNGFGIVSSLSLTDWMLDAVYWISTSLMILLLISQFPQHFALRLILYFEHKLPLRLVSFLDRMTDQHIFEDNRRTIKGKKQRGASWRFRHKILQDYFAGLGEVSSFDPDSSGEKGDISPSF